MLNKSLENTVAPIWLPQIEEEHVEELLSQLADQGVIVKKLMISPKYLNPLQKKVKKAKIDDINKSIDNDDYLPQTWVDSDNNILDGHHRAYAYQSRNDIDKVECYKIFLNTHDAARAINKNLDRINFKKEFNIDDDHYKFDDTVFKSDAEDGDEEPETYNKMPDSNSDDKTTDITPDKDNDQEEVLDEVKVKGIDLDFDDLDSKIVKLYGSTPFNKKAEYGEILSFKKGKGYQLEYEMQFDKILNIPKEKYDLYDPFYLSAIYTLQPNFEKNIEKIKTFATGKGLLLAEYTKRKLNKLAFDNGYDGINFGDLFMMVVTQGK